MSDRLPGAEPVMVRLPRSCRRRGVMDYAKLLRRVAPHASTGFDYEGVLVKPGAWLERRELWPAPEYPRQPVLLECAGPQRPGWGHNRAPELFILWRYDLEAGAWMELARTEAQGWEWPAILASAARATIAEQLPARPCAEASAVVSRIARMLDAELETVAPADRGRVLAILHEQWAARAAQLALEPPAPLVSPGLASRSRLACTRAT